MKQPAEWVPGGRTVTWFAASSGALVDARDARSLPRQAAVYNFLFPLHAAEVDGLLYRLLMTILGLTLAMLGTLTVWTFWFRGGARSMKQPSSKTRRQKV